jgi:hypothetical protein
LHATIDVYAHKLKPGQGTSTAIWVNHNGDGALSSLNAICVGWHVRITLAFSIETSLFNSNTCLGTRFDFLHA